MRASIIRKGKPVCLHTFFTVFPHIGSKTPWGEVVAISRDKQTGEVQVHVA